MDCLQTNAWPTNVVCGNGYCMKQNVSIRMNDFVEMGVCVCNNSYLHDLTFGRYRSCTFPSIIIFQAYFIIFGLMGLCLVVFSMLKIPNSRNLARHALILGL